MVNVKDFQLSIDFIIGSIMLDVIMVKNGSVRVREAVVDRRSICVVTVKTVDLVNVDAVVVKRMSNTCFANLLILIDRDNVGHHVY